MRPAVEVEDVFRVYATDEGTAAALQGLSLTVDEGEVVAVLGPSGSGKTTLLRILAGLDRPSAGRVRVAGVDLRRLRGRGLDRYRSGRLGYADQRYTQALAPELTAGSSSRSGSRSPASRPASGASAPPSCSTRSASQTGRRVPARAVRRRAATGRALRRARAPPAAPARRRADGRARREERRASSTS